MSNTVFKELTDLARSTGYTAALTDVLEIIRLYCESTQSFPECLEKVYQEVVNLKERHN